MTQGSSDVLILFAHGARDPEWRGPVDALAARMRGALPGTRVECAFLDFMAPTLPETITTAVDAGALRIVIAPVFWAPGGHLKHDVPALLDDARRRHPEVAFSLWPALGESEAVLDAIAAAYGRLWASGVIPCNAG